MTAVEFTVVGIPKPQGSKRAFVANGRAIMTEASGKDHAAWRNAVADKAREVATAPLDGPLALSIDFRFPMPKSRPKADRERGWCPKTTAPDLDKLVRTVCDGLQAAGLVTDDARFWTIRATKSEIIGWTGATIRILRKNPPC